MVETRNSKKIKENQNPKKLYSRFIFKALILAVFCSIVPLFLSQTPELSNQTSLLELLHLIFVGIAVSYGLFSRRNYDGGGGSTNKTDHSSHVPKILEVPSSVFNVHHQESESDDSSGDYTNIQTWKNKHHMNIPEIVLSKIHHFGEKPLLLPVRSLNQSLRVSDSGENSGRWEKVRSKRQLLKNLVDDDDDDNNDVLPSPIPWRSRSSSIESLPSIKNLTTVDSQPLIKTPANLTSSSSSSPRKHKFHDEFHSPPSPPPLPTFYNSLSRKENPANLTSSSSFSSPTKSTALPESGAKSAENIAGKHSFHGEFHTPPSPPPPPPPLPAFYRSKSRESAHKTKFGDGEFHPPPPPPVDYYMSAPTKLRVSRKLSENKPKFDDRSSKRNNLKKVWWSDPIVELKEQETEKKSYLGSKASENEEEQRSRDSENDEVKEKKIEEEGVCESNNVSDVDKKADEFIAKFREQIRLQRIESIKRAAYKISAKFSR